MKPIAPAFVLCPAYHGATLFGLLVNNHSQLTSLGDTLPERNHLDYFCSCGARIQDCDFWRTVANRTNADQYAREEKMLPVVPRIRSDEQENFKLNRKIGRGSRLYQAIYWKGLARAQSQRFLDAAIGLQLVACELQGTALFVDGCKEPSRVHAFEMLSGARYVKVIHLVRDPRGFYNSYSNHHGPEEAEEWAIQTWMDTHHEIVADFARRLEARYLRVRYEDLCRHPRKEMARVFAFLGVPDENILRPPTPPHHLIGNQMLATFNGEICEDIRWKDRLSDSDQSDMLRRAEPLAAALGYMH